MFEVRIQDDDAAGVNTCRQAVDTVTFKINKNSTRRARLIPGRRLHPDCHPEP